MADELDIPMPRMMPTGGAAGASVWRNTSRRDGSDSTLRRMVLFAGVVGAGMLLAVGVWSFVGHRASGVPVVEADSRPLRTKPENPGGMQVSGQDDAILSGTSEGADAMAPPPETPAPQALREAAAAPATTAPAATTPAAPATAAAPPLVVAQPAQRVSLAAPAPPRQPLAVAAAPEQPAKALLPPLLPHVAGPAVQLGSLVTEDAAKAEWQRLLHRAPELLGGRAPLISRLARDDGKVFWRLRTAGFPDIAQATAFCEKARAKGLSCSLSSS